MEYNFRETFDRTELQAYAEKKRQEAETLRLQRVRQQVTSVVDSQTQNILKAAQEEKTSFLVELVNDHRATGYDVVVTNEEYLSGFREKFPGCSVELVEEWVDVPNRHRGQPPTRVLKSGIKIDWS